MVPTDALKCHLISSCSEDGKRCMLQLSSLRLQRPPGSNGNTREAGVRSTGSGIPGGIRGGVASCAVSEYTVPAAVRHGDIADTHTAPSHTDAKRRQREVRITLQRSTSTTTATHTRHRPRRASHIMHHHTLHELRQRILSSLESLRKLQELT